ncbi:HAD family hydrolase [Reinekea sp. G2M2-21]|uniref:HAD family hydrolase n=1 Tax=Reinekea sp. G2M2-21 TaxID=2788942 RepID=UPI0018AACF89|nr:HAD-IA family hydrolase [Reinekea sp. G2M2-21]
MYALFDLDDTVHDKKQSLYACARSIYSKFLDDRINADEFVKAFVSENCIIQPKVDVFKTLGVKFGIDSEIESKMLMYFDESFQNYSKRFYGVLECMEYLKNEGVKMACVTNGRNFFQRNKITALGLDTFFDVIVTSGELDVKKPDPFIFNVALEKLGAKAEESVFVGDNLKADMEPAKNLGMNTIWVSADTKSKPEFVDFKLSSFSEFVGIWQAITSS